MYLVVDMNSDYTEKMDYRGIKKLLIETIQEDLLTNNGEYEIVRDCSNELVKMAKEDWIDESWIIDLLKSYSYNVIDLSQVIHDLGYIKDCYKENLEYYGKIDEAINIISKGEK